jgi:ADP-ribose pyrophosphatase YjhB (NUDIX family)
MDIQKRRTTRDIKATVVVLVQLVNAAKLLGYVLVRNTLRYPRSQAFYKLPGGSQKEGESLIEAAYWECFEESGIDLAPSLDTLQYRQYIPDGYYTKHLFVAQIDTRQAMGLYNPSANPGVLKPRGNQGECGHILSPSAFLTQIVYGGILKSHLEMLEAAKIIEHIRTGTIVE